MIEAQGGDPRVIDQPGLLPLSDQAGLMCAEREESLPPAMPGSSVRPPWRSARAGTKWMTWWIWAWESMSSPRLARRSRRETAAAGLLP